MNAEGAAFDASWLALRRPADARARHPGLLDAASAQIAALHAPLIVDIGSGAGVRAIRHPTARWRFVDQDAALLALAAGAAAADGVAAETVRIDLAASAPALRDVLDGADLVTASAFFDLVSADWLDRLVAALPPRAAFYAALSYSGEMTWSPPDAADPAVLDAFNRHQRGDKGFGPALGPAAAPYLADRLSAGARACRIERSDWDLKAGRDDALIAELTKGIAEAAGAMGVDVAAWSASRRRIVRATVSHLDVYAAPPPADA